MKSFSKIYLLGLAMALTQGCGPSSKEMENKEKAAHTEDNGLAGSAGSPMLHSSASKITKTDSTRQFIRTADIKFKVKNVEGSTYKIEDVVSHFEGFVINTTLNCRVNYTDEYRVKDDSVVQRKHYVVENNLTFRVPNFLLDTTLKQIASQIDFLDYRIIKAEDVSFQALKQSLKDKRYKQQEQHLTKAIDTKKTKDVVEAENSLFSKQDQSDDNAIAGLELRDKIAYSTVQLLIYEDEKVKAETVFSEQKTPAYTKPFATELISSAKMGWQLIEFLILLIVKLWPLVLIGVAVYVGVKQLAKKRQ